MIAVPLPGYLEDARLHFGFEAVLWFVVFKIAGLREAEYRKKED